MANQDQIAALVRAHRDGDDVRFSTTVSQIIAHEEAAKRFAVAHKLRTILASPKPQGMKPLVLADDGDLLWSAHPTSHLSDMTLGDTTLARLTRILKEQEKRDDLRAVGLRSSQRLLLSGPPGTGKTMTASALAGELGLPLYVMKLHGIITSFLGETAKKLAKVFAQIEQVRGVYLLDEFDALGMARDGKNKETDVGEMRRSLNSLLTFLERDHDSLIVAATNHAHLLDEALFRRFDAVIHYEPPSWPEARQLMQARLSLMGGGDLDLMAKLFGPIDWEQVHGAFVSGMSHADVVVACEDAAKVAILNETRVATDSLKAALAARFSETGARN